MSGARSINELVLAIRSRDIPSVLECLNSGIIDLNQRDKNGFTPLTAACGDSFKPEVELEIMELLLMRGASATYLDGRGWAPVHVAAFECGNEFLDLLIRHKADLDVKSEDENGSTPLILAVRAMTHVEERAECVKFLLEHRASASLTDKKGKTALYHSKDDVDASSISEMLEAAMKQENEIEKTSSHQPPKLR